MVIYGLLKDTGPASYTKKTKKKTGRQEQQQPDDNYSSDASTTETTGTSSTELHRRTTQHDSGRESPTSLIQQLQETQKLLSRVSQFAFSDDLFSIASATVSRHFISMELRSEQN